MLQTGIEEYQWLRSFCRSMHYRSSMFQSLDVPAQTEYYTDLSRSNLYLKFRILNLQDIIADGRQSKSS